MSANKQADLLVDSYNSWLQERVSAEIVENDTIEVTTPFLDRHNDHLQIYAEKQEADLYVLTDDGYITAELKASGVERKGPRREAILQQIISGYGVSLDGTELRTLATARDVGQRLHNLIQAMLRVDDLALLSQPNVQSIFSEDVARFLDHNNVRYTPRAKFSGKSGLDHLIDFVIPKSEKAPERMLQVINDPRRGRVENIIFSINDIREIRGANTLNYALLNDTKRGIAADTIEAFERYGIHARPWSHRDDLAKDLAA